MHDLELLHHYSKRGDQAAFSTLVGRYVDFVYSAARRQLQSSELAEEVTQTVFLDLARQAHRLRADSHIGSWLYVVVRRASIDAIRRESRRRRRDQIAVEGASMSTPTTPPFWLQIEPLLDEAISALDETDRKAILLRFFEKRKFSEIGRVLNMSEEAAQKKVRRAIDHLGHSLGRRGVTASSAILAAEITPNAIKAAPAGLAASVSAAISLGGSVIPATATIRTAHAITASAIAKESASIGILAFMTATKSTLLIASTAALLALGYSTYEYREAAMRQAVVTALTGERNRLQEAVAQSKHQATTYNHRAILAEREVSDLQRKLNQVLGEGPAQPTKTASSTNDARKLAAEKMAQMKPLLLSGMPIKGAAVLYVNGSAVDQQVELVIGKETRIEGDEGTYIVTPILNEDGSVKYPFRLVSNDRNGGSAGAQWRVTVIAAPWGAFSLGNSVSGNALGFVPDMNGP